MNTNKTIYKSNFQHFPSHLVAQSQVLIFLNFSLFNLHCTTGGSNRKLFSTNSIGREKKPLHLIEPFN